MQPSGIGDAAQLRNGVRMPWLGLGVYQVDEGDVRAAVGHALRVGYRHVDTAKLYGNERGVGEAVRASGLSRADVFVTTKVWNTDQGYDETLRACEDSLSRLGMDYVDLYLVHWPKPARTRDTWRAMERLYHDGKARAIGVCNFKEHHLADLLQHAEVAPMVDQFELHPYLGLGDLRGFCARNGIQAEAWAPIARGRLDAPALQEIARDHGRTPAQVVLRWHLQNGVVAIPKSVRPARIEENAAIFDFSLSDGEMARIDALDAGERLGPDPDRINF